MQTIDELLVEHSNLKSSLKNVLNKKNSLIADNLPYRKYLENYHKYNFLNPIATPPLLSGTIENKLLMLNNISNTFRKLFPGKPPFKLTPYLFDEYLKKPTTASSVKSKFFTENSNGFHFELSDKNYEMFTLRRNLFDRTDLSAKEGQAFLQSSGAIVTTLSNGMKGRDLVVGTDNYFYLKGTTSIGTYTFSCIIETGDASAPVITTTQDASTDCSFVYQNRLVPVTSITHISGSLYRAIAVIESTDGVHNFGVVKYSVNSTKTIKVSGYQLEKGSNATEYEEFLDFKSYFKSKYPNHNLYQDIHGITPVFDYDQPVGLWLDTGFGEDNRKILYSSNKELFNSPWVLTGLTKSGSTITGVGSAKLKGVFGVLKDVIELKLKGSSTVSWTIKGGTSFSTTVESGSFDLSFTSGSLALDSLDLILELTTTGSLTIDQIDICKIKGNHATQITTSCRPLLKRDTNLNRDYLLFDGVNDYFILEGKSKYRYLHDGSPYSIFFNASGAKSKYNTILTNNNLGSIGVGVSFALDFRSLKSSFANFRNGTATSYATGGVGVADYNTPVAFSYRINNSHSYEADALNNHVRVLMNGAPFAGNSTRELTIGKSLASTTANLTGRVYEILCIDKYVSYYDYIHLNNIFHRNVNSITDRTIDMVEETLKEPFLEKNSSGFYIDPNKLENLWSDPYCLNKATINSSVGFISDPSQSYNTSNSQNILPNLTVTTTPASVTKNAAYYTMGGSTDNKITLSGFSANKLYSILTHTVAFVSGNLTFEYKGITSTTNITDIDYKPVYFYSGETPSTLTISSTNTSTNIKFSILDIKEVDGNHFVQETLANRPILRVNSTTLKNYLDFSTSTSQLKSVKNKALGSNGTLITSITQPGYVNTDTVVKPILSNTSGVGSIYSKPSQGLFIKDIGNNTYIPSKINETLVCSFYKGDAVIQNDLFTNGTTVENPFNTTGKLFLGYNGTEAPKMHVYGMFYINRNLTRKELSTVRNNLGGFNQSLDTLRLKGRELSVKDSSGLVIDANDFQSMYQDIGGTLPVTKFGQPVSIILDKDSSKHVSDNIAKTTRITGPATSSTVALYTFPVSDKSLDSNSLYEIKFKVSDSVRIGEDIGMTTLNFKTRVRVTGDGEYSFTTFTENNPGLPTFFTRHNFSATISNISIRKISTNFAYQESSDSRPLVQKSSNGCAYLSFDGIDDYLETNPLSLGNSYQILFHTPIAPTASGNFYNTIFHTTKEGYDFGFYFVDDPSFLIQNWYISNSLGPIPINSKPYICSINTSTVGSTVNSKISVGGDDYYSLKREEVVLGDFKGCVYNIGRRTSNIYFYNGGIGYLSLSSSKLNKSVSSVITELKKRG